MIKKNIIALLLAFTSILAFLPQARAAAPYHVSDDVSIALHSGPSNQYRIKGWLPSGSELTLISKDASSGYAQVKTDKGSVGWISGKYLEEGRSVKARLPEIEQALTETKSALAEEQQKNETLSEQLSGLNQKHRSELSTINEARAEGTAQIAQLENEITRLQNQIDSMDETNLMGWFIRGGGVALAGILIGLIIPSLPKKRRRNSDWF